MFCAIHFVPDKHACDMLIEYDESKEERDKETKEAEEKERHRVEVEQERENSRREKAIADEILLCALRGCHAFNDPDNLCKSCKKTFCDEHHFEHDCPNNAPVTLADKHASAKFFSRDICCMPGCTISPAHLCLCGKKFCGGQHLEQDKHHCTMLLSSRATMTPTSSTSTRALISTSKAFKTPKASAPTLGAATGKRPADDATSSNVAALKKIKKCHRLYCFHHGYDDHWGNGCSHMKKGTQSGNKFTDEMRLAKIPCTLQDRGGNAVTGSKKVPKS
jgi:hypothetical protein